MNFSLLKQPIIELAQENPDIDILWLYGSQADGTAHSGSDIDLAVCFKHWEEDVLERRLLPEMLALDWQRSLGLGEGQLSIVDINHAPIGLGMSVLNYACVLVCKNNARKMREQQRIMSMWETDYLYHYKTFNQGVS